MADEQTFKVGDCVKRIPDSANYQKGKVLGFTRSGTILVEWWRAIYRTSWINEQGHFVCGFRPHPDGIEVHSQRELEHREPF